MDINRIQIKTNNPGTSIVDVYIVDDSRVTNVFTQSEIYETVDYSDQSNKEEILIMSPIAVGTSWEIDDGAIREITSVDKSIVTPYSNFQAVEITTTFADSVTYDYYVKDIGHVMGQFVFGETGEKISSELAEFTFD